VGDWYYGFAISIHVSAGAQTKVFTVTQTITEAVSIRLNTDDTLALYRDDTNAQQGSNSAVLTKDQVYFVSFRWNSTISDGTVTAKLDDVQFATGTAANNQSQYRVKWGILTSTTGEIYIDDIYVNNASGSVNNSYPTSDMYLIVGRPEAIGDFNECSAGDYSDVDEVTADDDTTKATFDADNDRLDVNIVDVATYYALSTTTDTIPFVAVWARDRANSPAEEIWNVRIKSQASGTLGTGPSRTHNDTTYKTNGDIAPLLPYVSELNPQDSAAWEV